jgi:hypothetical protein
MDGFFAEIICDALTQPPTWHCIVQHEGCDDVLFWAQEPSWNEAMAVAGVALHDFREADSQVRKEMPQATIADKKFMTLHATTRRLRSRR